MQKIISIVLSFLLIAGMEAMGQDITTRLLTLTAPPPPTVKQVSTTVVGNPGNATYYYWVVAKYASGNANPSAAAIVINAPNVLSVSAYIRVNWDAVAGATGYDVLRTTTASVPNGNCNCAVVTATASTTVNDQGGALGAYTVSSQGAVSSSCNLDNLSSATPVVTCAPYGWTPGGAAGGALTGTYPNPLIANLTTVGAVPYVSSAGVLTQAPTGLFYDSAVQSLKMGAAKVGTGSASRAEFSYNTSFAGSNFALIQDSSAKTFLNSSVSQGLVFSLSNTEVARFAPTTGNLLLGTTTDDGSNKLQVAGNMKVTSTDFVISELSSSNVIGAYYRLTKTAGTAQSWDFGVGGTSGGNDGAFGLYDNTASAWRFQVKTNGNVLIGTTTDGNYKLDIAASGSSGTFRVYDQTATTGSTSLVVRAGAGQSTNDLQQWQNNGGTKTAWVSSLGGIFSNTRVASSGDLLLNTSGAVQFTNPSDGVLTLKDNAGTSFNRIQIGGTTSSFPAIARSGAELYFKLADDSAGAVVRAGGYKSSDGTAGVTVTTCTGFKNGLCISGT